MAPPVVMRRDSCISEYLDVMRAHRAHKPFQQTPRSIADNKAIYKAIDSAFMLSRAENSVSAAYNPHLKLRELSTNEERRGC